jgi:hypothetical protein
MIVPTIGRVVWYFPSEDDLSKLGMVKHGEQAVRCACHLRLV